MNYCFNWIENMEQVTSCLTCVLYNIEHGTSPLYIRDLCSLLSGVAVVVTRKRCARHTLTPFMPVLRKKAKRLDYRRKRLIVKEI